MRRKYKVAMALAGLSLVTWFVVLPMVKRHYAVSICTTVQKGVWDEANNVCRF